MQMATAEAFLINKESGQARGRDRHFDALSELITHADEKKYVSGTGK